MQQKPHLLLISDSQSLNVNIAARFVLDQQQYSYDLILDPTPEEITLLRKRPELVVLLPCERKEEIFDTLLLKFHKPKILVVGEDRLDEYAPYLHRGAAGYLYHREISTRLCSSIESIRTVSLLVNRHLKHTLYTSVRPADESGRKLRKLATELTELDKKILRLMNANPGVPYRLIAAKLSISVETVKKRTGSIVRRAGLSNRVELQLHMQELCG